MIYGYFNPSFILDPLLFILFSSSLGSQRNGCIEIPSAGQLDLLLVGNFLLALIYDGLRGGFNSGRTRHMPWAPTSEGSRKTFKFYWK